MAICRISILLPFAAKSWNIKNIGVQKEEGGGLLKD
jgi:hypothetical protein